MAWLKQSSLRRNRSVRPCLLLYLHGAHIMLLLKMLVPKSQNNQSRRTEPRTSVTTRRPVLRCEPVGPCCLRLRLPLRGRAGGTQNFFSELCFQSCFWTLSSCTRSVCRRTPLVCSQTGWRESAPSKLLQVELEVQRPAGVVPNSSSTSEDFFFFSKFQPCPISLQIEAKSGRTTGEITTCPVTATQ